MPRGRPDSSSAGVAKWEPFLDDDGNLYFYNHVMGESVWELPPEDGESHDQALEQQTSKPHGSPGNTSGGDGDTDKSTADFSPYSVAVAVVETVVKLVDSVDTSPGKAASTRKEKRKEVFISPAAESRRRKNDVKAQARKQRLHSISADKYMKLELPPVSPTAGTVRDENLVGDAKLRRTGSLFTAQDSEMWQREVEAERARERRANRMLRQQHKRDVRSLKRQQIMLLQLRTELTKHLLGEIQCSPELLKQKILLLSNQTPQSILATSRLEPEVAEKLAAAQRQAQEERRDAIQAAFELLDSAKSGKIRLVSIITGIFTHEAQIQQYCAIVKGLGEVLSSSHLQQFILSFASSRQHDCQVTAVEFHEFLSIIEEAWDHYSRIKTAVHDAENDIDAAIAAATLRPGTGAMRARMGFVSKKKAEHELAQLQERAALLRSISSAAVEEPQWTYEDSLIPQKEAWEKDHHHRFIRAPRDGHMYCCLCRRRQWELVRVDIDDGEQRHRDEWPSLLELRLKEAEVRMAGGSPGGDNMTVSPPASPGKGGSNSSVVEQDFVSFKLATLTDDSEIAVLEVLHTVLVVIESLASDDDGQHAQRTGARHRVHRRRKQQSAMNSAFRRAEPTTGLSPMQMLESTFRAEELARRALFEEERAIQIEVERHRRHQERPQLRSQEAASDNYVRILERCVSLPPLLSNVRFERCLSLKSSEKMTLLMANSASPDIAAPLALYTLAHRTESEANYTLEQLKVLQQRLRSPFVVAMRLVDTRSFQSFSESGMLVEYWPIQFVATEFFPRGSWLEQYRRWIHGDSLRDAITYAQVEQHVLAVFRDVATGVSAMHSLGVLHLNIKADCIFVCSDDAEAGDRSTLPQQARVRVGGLLSWKAGYNRDSLGEGDVLESMHFNYAPPEALDRRPITSKADVWMLGCSMLDALLLWQHVQLAAGATNSSVKHPRLVFSSRDVHDLLLMLPLATSTAVRSLIRMMLQPEPAARPDMSQVAEYMSFATVKTR